MLTDKDLERIEEYVNLADPGPWFDDEVEGIISRFTPLGQVTTVAAILDPQNIPLMAHARQDLPALVSEVRRRRQERRWIPVTERLPEYGQAVLVYSQDTGMELGYRDRDTGVKAGEDYWRALCCSRLTDITHWQPLPQGPGEE